MSYSLLCLPHSCRLHIGVQFLNSFKFLTEQRLSLHLDVQSHGHSISIIYRAPAPAMRSQNVWNWIFFGLIPHFALRKYRIYIYIYMSLWSLDYVTIMFRVQSYDHMSLNTLFMHVSFIGSWWVVFVLRTYFLIYLAVVVCRSSIRTDIDLEKLTL